MQKPERPTYATTENNPDRINTGHHEHDDGLTREDLTVVEEFPIKGGVIQALQCEECDYWDLRVEHQKELSFDVEERSRELLEEIDLPVVRVYQKSGSMGTNMGVLRTAEEAKEYHRRRFGTVQDGPLNRIYKSPTSSTSNVTRTLRKVDTPCVLCLTDGDGNALHTNLHPSDELRPDSAPHWERTVREVLEEHFLNRPWYRIASGPGFPRWPGTDAYDPERLEEALALIPELELHIQTPELLQPEDRSADDDADGTEVSA